MLAEARELFDAGEYDKSIRFWSRNEHAETAALRALSKTNEGQAAAAAALDGLLKHPEVVKQEARYGGAFQGRLLKTVSQ